MKREFKPYVSKAGTGVKYLLSRHPKMVFSLMVISILLSAILAFTVFRQRPNNEHVQKPVRIAGPVSTGMDQLLATGEALQEMMRLKQAIDSLSAKKQLNSADSLALEKALDRFQQLNRKFNQRK
nr:hypothetical protein [Mucilaginibacter sp. X5P1]